MAEKMEKECPQCHGAKTIAGTCECNAEWRGSETDGEWDDCQCVRESDCPMCRGTGTVEES